MQTLTLRALGSRLATSTIFGLASLFASACGGSPQSDGSVTKIIGGSTSDEGEDPAVVAIYVEIMAREARFMCTGTLIAPNLVLTAAHCLDQPRLQWAHVFRVFSGTDLRKEEDRPRPVTGGEAHFDREFRYSQPELGHDIGVLTLREPITDIKPIPYLRTPMSRDWIGKKVRVVGYGTNSGLLGTGTQVKRSNMIKLNDFSDRFVEVGGFFNNVCRGDSGGPVLMEIDGVETVVGVNSYGTGTCHSSSTATRVDAYNAKIIDPLMQAAAQ
jgi:secreted trypsin-like serine protease